MPFLFLRSLTGKLFPQLLVAALCLAALASSAFASPSGGPYGPLAYDYAIPQVKGRLFFISTDAVPSGKGLTLEAPCTLEYAISEAKSNDALILRGGLYRVGGLLTNQGITLQAYRNETPVLTGTLPAKEWTKQKNGLWRTKWTSLFPSKPADWWRRESDGANTPLHRFNNDLVFADGRRLKSVGWEGALDANSFYIDYENAAVYLALDPTQHAVEITAHDSALVRTLKPCQGKESDGLGLHLKGITFTRYAYRALEIEGTEPEGLAEEGTYGNEVPGSTLENVSITHCSRVAAYLRGNKITIRHCLISDTTTEGLYLIASCDSLLEKNIIRRNNCDDMRGYFPSAVKIFNQSHRVVCRDNLVVENHYSNGIWYDVGNCDAVFVDNWIEDAQNGFFFEISKRALAIGNIFVNCEAGLKSLNSCGVEAYHNTFINAPAAFERNERSALADHFGWHPSTGPDVNERENHSFAGNLLFGDADNPEVLLQIWQPGKMNARLPAPQFTLLDANLYVVAGGSKKTLIDWSPASGDKHHETLASLAALQGLTPQFAQHSLSLNTGDFAFFKARELSNYRPLTAGLPTLDKALLPAALLERLRPYLTGTAATSETAFGAY